MLSREDPRSFHGDRREEGETRWERRLGDRWEKPRESPSGDSAFSGKRRPDLLFSREQSGWGSEEVRNRRCGEWESELTRPWRGVQWEHRTVIPIGEDGRKDLEHRRCSTHAFLVWLGLGWAFFAFLSMMILREEGACVG